MNLRSILALASALVMVGGFLGTALAPDGTQHAIPQGHARATGLTSVVHPIHPPLPSRVGHQRPTGHPSRLDPVTKAWKRVHSPGADLPGNSPVVSTVLRASSVHLFRKDTPSRSNLRKRILAEIGSDPGIHYHELLRRVGSGSGTLSYHLHQMERAGLVRSQRQGGRRLLFELRFQPKLPVAPRGTTGRVFNFIQQSPESSSLGVSRALGLLPSNASYHLHKLNDQGLVRATREGRFVLWSVAEL